MNPYRLRTNLPCTRLIFALHIIQSAKYLAGKITAAMTVKFHTYPIRLLKIQQGPALMPDKFVNM